MTVAPVPLAEVTTTAIGLLCREIGPVNTARFLNQFTMGFGNYREQRDEILGEPTVDELVAEIHQQREKKSKSSTSARKRNRSKQ